MDCKGVTVKQIAAHLMDIKEYSHTEHQNKFLELVEHALSKNFYYFKYRHDLDQDDTYRLHLADTSLRYVNMCIADTFKRYNLNVGDNRPDLLPAIDNLVVYLEACYGAVGDDDKPIALSALTSVVAAARGVISNYHHPVQRRRGLMGIFAKD
jgi:hypothetical protein